MHNAEIPEWNRALLYSINDMSAFAVFLNNTTKQLLINRCSQTEDEDVMLNKGPAATLTA